MLKFLVALVAIPGMNLTLAAATAAQTFPSNLPIAITCYANRQAVLDCYDKALDEPRANGRVLDLPRPR